MKPEIKYVNYGIACRIGGKVYLNKRLKKKEWKKLHDVILTHELSHSEGFNKKDFVSDLNNFDLEPVKLDYYRFVKKNPTTWIEYLPFWFYEGDIVFSPGMIGLWAFVIALTVLGIIF